MFAYVLLGLAAISAVSADCYFDMNKDLPKHKAPLFFDEDEEFLLPEPHGKTGLLHIASNEAVTLACPGSKIAKAKAPMVTAICSRGNKLNVNGQDLPIQSLGCARTAAASLRVTDRSCEEEGTVLEMGFQVDEDDFETMVESCHQVDKANTLYSRHILRGAALAGAEVQSKRPGFKGGDHALYRGVNINDLYKQKTHFRMLEDVLGKRTANKLKEITFIARGHLAPDADFLFGSWQWTTYFYANAAPQWQSFNAGHWLAVEKAARAKAIELGRDVIVYTGTEGILTLPNDDGEPTPLYLEPDQQKVPIPNHYWKVLYDPVDKQGIALVGSNNPLLESTEDTICRDVCEEYGWRSYKSDLTKGHIFCCSVEDLRKVVPYAPELEINGVLEGPQ